MLYLGIFWLELLKQLLSYLKLTASNLSARKVCIKAKNFKFGTKNVVLGYFWVGL